MVRVWEVTAYIFSLLKYMTMQIDEKPFPFDDWPSDKTAKDVKKNKIK
jgi:hypothetical protein